MTAWQCIRARYIHPDPIQFALAAFALAVAVSGVLGALILDWPDLGAMLVMAWVGYYILRGNFWKARALEAEADEHEKATNGH